MKKENFLRFLNCAFYLGNKSINDESLVNCSNSSDSDDAPEEFTFSSGRADALSAIKSQQLADKETRELKRKRRQIKDIQLCKQKEEKLSRLKSLKLPDELFDNVLSPSSTKPEKSRKISKQESVPRTHLSIFK